MEKLIWTDTETTGINPGDIMEVGIEVTDFDLNVLDRYHALVQYDPENLNDFTRGMHKENGLIEDIENAGGGDHPLKVRDEVVSLLKMHQVDDNRKTLRLAGNNVRAFDGRFFDVVMPGIMSEVHYRELDISTLHEALYVATGKDHRPDSEATHRVFEDIAWSQRLWKIWREVCGL